ncbi:PRC-barrel domain-containing protein [Streptomyces aidingensis]|uniref:PRC-barrel domain-containing protein n=1 Tax=Streptomyces aidingensis TaxID=910347 RepID=A0A1I1PGP2_9ACTN|nr:PRC-barrel domain-containing protein [Streptomyces aidingensis]
MQTDIDPRSLIGRKALDRNGAKIGTVDEVYLDDATGVPEWAAVRTGLFSRDAFVPLEPSELVEETLRVPFDRELIRQAPDFGVGRHLSPEQELQLYHHYGLDVPGAPAAEDRDFGRLAGRERPRHGPAGHAPGPVYSPGGPKDAAAEPDAPEEGGPPGAAGPERPGPAERS